MSSIQPLPSTPRASAWSSSAAATRAPTAWAPAFARAPGASTSSRSCPSRPRQRSTVHSVADVAPAVAHRKRARRGRHPRLGREQRPLHRRRRTATSSSCTWCAWVRRPASRPFPARSSRLDVDLVLLAMGFLGPVRSGLIEQLGLALDNRGNVAANAAYMTSVEGHLCRRRYAPRPVARRLGHRRRPQGRRRHRQLPHRQR